MHITSAAPTFQFLGIFLYISYLQIECNLRTSLESSGLFLYVFNFGSLLDRCCNGWIMKCQSFLVIYWTVSTLCELINPVLISVKSANLKTFYVSISHTLSVKNWIDLCSSTTLGQSGNASWECLWISADNSSKIYPFCFVLRL